jgi:phosphatidylglycerol:prolipoprotein diacylglycerol transferase
VKYLKYITIIIALILVEYLFLRGIWTFPQYIDLGVIQIHFYSVFLLSAFILVAFFYKKYVEQDSKLKHIVIEDALVWTLIPAILLARVWHVATDFHLYEGNLLGALQIWNGGLSIFGGLLGGAVGIYLYCRRNAVDYLHALDLLAVFLPLGQVVGRYGNFANQELYGKQTDLPWGIYIRDQKDYFHPAFLYEQLGNLALFLLLFTLFRKKKLQLGSGQFTALYFLGYGIVRFLVDFARTDPNVVWIFSVGQIVSILFVLAASGYLLVKKNPLQLNGSPMQ